jgi:hypothetical protein
MKRRGEREWEGEETGWWNRTSESVREVRERGEKGRGGEREKKEVESSKDTRMSC